MLPKVQFVRYNFSDAGAIETVDSGKITGSGMTKGTMPGSR